MWVVLQNLGSAIVLYNLAMLLIKFLQFKAAIALVAFELVNSLRGNLFTYSDLRDWLDRPEGPPAFEPLPTQKPLPFLLFGQHVLPKLATDP
jgi:hypothetical protein